MFCCSPQLVLPLTAHPFRDGAGVPCWAGLGWAGLGCGLALDCPYLALPHRSRPPPPNTSKRPPPPVSPVPHQMQQTPSGQTLRPSSSRPVRGLVDHLSSRISGGSKTSFGKRKGYSHDKRHSHISERSDEDVSIGLESSLEVSFRSFAGALSPAAVAAAAGATTAAVDAAAAAAAAAARPGGEAGVVDGGQVDGGYEAGFISEGDASPTEDSRRLRRSGRGGVRGDGGGGGGWREAVGPQKSSSEEASTDEASPPDVIMPSRLVDVSAGGRMFFLCARVWGGGRGKGWGGGR